MLKRLREKWRVTNGQLLLILLTFAAGGSLCGYAARVFLGFLHPAQGIIWGLLYVLFIVILWPIAVLLVSLPLGQFPFFKSYVLHIFQRVSGKRKLLPNVAIFASGAGSNAAVLIKEITRGHVALVVTNNASAGVLRVAAAQNIPAAVIDLKNKTAAGSAEAYSQLLRKYDIDFILLAGYLKKIPAGVIRAFPKRIINIHPALLPKYGGAGMYGERVHQAVIAAGEKQSGITIHLVDEIYDNGEILFQARCAIDPADDAASLAKKVLALEHAHYSKQADELMHSQNRR